MKKNLHRAALCLVFGFAVIGLLSESSPLYTFNSWCDANIYLTTAREMLHGKMLYRDVFDHKGPYLYLIHLLAVLIDQWSFRGVYIMESLAASAYAYLSLKAVKADSKRKIFMALAGCAAVYGCGAFMKGDSAEEFCLPLLMGSLIAAETESYLAVGIMAGMIFWTKMTMCSFYVGWYIVMLMKNWRKAIAGIPKIIIGLMISSLPIMIMFIGNYDSLWKGYFVSNISYGSQQTHVLEDAFLYGYTLVTCAVPLMMNAVALTQKKWRGMIILTGFFLIFPILSVSFLFTYYWLPLMCYAPLWADMDIKNANAIIISAAVIPMAFLFGNVRNIGKPVPQMKMVNIIKKDSHHGKIFQFGMLDYGFYTLLHQTPEEKYFFAPNMLSKEITEAQEKSVTGRRYKYVISRIRLGSMYKLIYTERDIDRGEIMYLYKLQK